MCDWRAAFCWVCPCDLPSSLPLPPSLSQSSPAGFTFSKYHHSSPGRGAGRGGRVGYGRGPVKGQCVCPSPLLFSSPQAAENIGLCHRQQPHSSLTSLTMELQIYSGEERPAPFYCSPAPSPLSLAPSYSAFLSVSPSFLDSPPSSLYPFTPSPSSPAWSLSPVSPHWGIIPPTLFHQSWAHCLGCPDSREEVAAYPSACPGLAKEKRGAEVLIHNNSH